MALPTAALRGDEIEREVALVACLSWLLTHRVLLNKGFRYSRRAISTDTAASLAIGLTATAWTTVCLWPVELEVFFTTLWVAPTDEPLSASTASISRAPVFVQCLFAIWLISGLDEFVASRYGRRPLTWTMSGVKSPYRWSEAMHPMLYWCTHLVIALLTLLQSYVNFLAGDIYRSTLTIAASLLFLFDGTADNPYMQAPHRYASDQLRIALPTSHHEGTVYVLPSVDRGFDAVWSPKVDSEHTEADKEMMPLFQRLRSERWTLDEPLHRIRNTVSAWFKKIDMKPDDVRLLADWIYLEPNVDVKRKMHAVRAPGAHLIGRDLMFALCHAEYLVFMTQGLLSERTRAKLGKLRLMKRSGATAKNEESLDTVGFKSGLAGFREAVRHVYAMFDEVIDETALDFQAGSPPAYSHTLSKQPESLSIYAAELWDMSCRNSESTFTALYFFTLVWSMELGNTHGFQLFPVQCKSRDGDFSSQKIVWRQLWFLGVMCQLVASSPILFGLFATGFLP